MIKTLAVILVGGIIALFLYFNFGKGASEIQLEGKSTTVRTSQEAKGGNEEEGKTGLANPASVNCTQKGGTLTIMENGAGAQFGLCNFEDNQACEEWALFRGDCPVGGVKVTGYDNVEQMYCAWLGGKTLAVVNSRCTLPAGVICSTDALYNGKCDESHSEQ